MWYENTYRRHLCDMHIEDWNETFLSEFSAEEYYENLVKAHIQAPMFYFQSHVGYSFYPTKTGHMHNSLLGDESKMKRLVELSHQGGMKVVGYYSLHYNNWAHDNFPEWRMRKEDGTSWREKGGRYGLCCSSNREYREFVFSQMKEIANYFRFEGMFFDMPFWPHVCYCDACKERYFQETCEKIPVASDLLKWNKFARIRERWMGEFVKDIEQEMKRLVSGVTVEFNFATACTEINRGVTEEVNKASEFANGDLYGGLLEQSFACKFYRNITRNQPFEYMTSRCNPDLTVHTITKSQEQIELSIMLTCAHHGASLIIDAIDPVGTLDPRVYDRIGAAFEREETYEPYLFGDMVEDIGLYYSMTSRENQRQDSFTNRSCVINSLKTMIENHIPTGVICNNNLDDLAKYKVVVVSNPCNMKEESIDKLISYVEGGGNLFFSNCDEKKLFETLTGGYLINYTKENITYVSPNKQYEKIFGWFNEKSPLPFKCHLPLVEGIAEEHVIATITLPYTTSGKRFSSIHANPPGIPTAYPALIKKAYGKGHVIWSAAPFEDQIVQDYKNIFIELINLLTGGQYTVQSDAPDNVEIISFQQDNAIQVNCIHLTETQGEIRQVEQLKIRVKTNRKVLNVSKLPTGKEIPFWQDNEQVAFYVDPFKIHDMYEIKF